ncbi:MAG: FKBP-type peptidyl-prolyl cis-trans isomerase [Bilophila wadsworthia]
MAVKDGNTVRVHYTGTFSDGEVFDSSREREPLEFTIGDGSLIPGFEDALLGHNAGDRFTVTIPADEAYGNIWKNSSWKCPWRSPRRHQARSGRDASNRHR